MSFLSLYCLRSEIHSNSQFHFFVRLCSAELFYYGKSFASSFNTYDNFATNVEKIFNQLRNDQTFSDIKLVCDDDFGGTVYIKWGECSAVAWCQSPWRGRDCIARKQPHPEKIVTLSLINMIHIHQSKNQAQTTKPIWITLLLHVKNLIIHNVSMWIGMVTPWCPPLWSHQGSSKSSNTKSCGCRLVGDEQGHPGDQGRCDWPEFWSRTWPMHIFQSAKSTKKGAVCQVPTVF